LWQVHLRTAVGHIVTGTPENRCRSYCDRHSVLVSTVYQPATESLYAKWHGLYFINPTIVVNLKMHYTRIPKETQHLQFVFMCVCVCVHRLFYTIKRKANCIHHILHRNCLLKHAIEGNIHRKIAVMARRCKQLLDDLKAMRVYWKLKKEAPDCTLWRTCFGRGYKTCC